MEKTATAQARKVSSVVERRWPLQEGREAESYAIKITLPLEKNEEFLQKVDLYFLASRQRYCGSAHRS
ncbi:hypothetical protein R0J89_16015, partial [Psychrobacter sp. SIMBA_152]